MCTRRSDPQEELIKKAAQFHPPQLVCSTTVGLWLVYRWY